MSNNQKERALFDSTLDGRGIWNIYNIKAIQAQTEELKNAFFEEMTWLSVNYPCKKCRNHMQKFIQGNPYEMFMYIFKGNKDIGCFKFIWSLHNSVNEKLGKPLMDFETAWNLFDPEIIRPCTAGCDDEEEDKQEKKVPEVLIKTKSNQPIRFIPTIRGRN